jgi:hypothetical protein
VRHRASTRIATSPDDLPPTQPRCLTLFGFGNGSGNENSKNITSRVWATNVARQIVFLTLPREAAPNVFPLRREHRTHARSAVAGGRIAWRTRILAKQVGGCWAKARLGAP